MVESGEDASFLPDGGFGEAFERCASCGATLPIDEWCPTMTETDDEGSLVVRTFCDEDCKDEWTGDAADE